MQLKEFHFFIAQALIEQIDLHNEVFLLKIKFFWQIQINSFHVH